jgi:hypothetical protein
MMWAGPDAIVVAQSHATRRVEVEGEVEVLGGTEVIWRKADSGALIDAVFFGRWEAAQDPQFVVATASDAWVCTESGRKARDGTVTWSAVHIDQSSVLASTGYSLPNDEGLLACSLSASPGGLLSASRGRDGKLRVREFNGAAKIVREATTEATAGKDAQVALFDDGRMIVGDRLDQKARIRWMRPFHTGP